MRLRIASHRSPYVSQENDYNGKRKGKEDEDEEMKIIGGGGGQSLYPSKMKIKVVPPRRREEEIAANYVPTVSHRHWNSKRKRRTRRSNQHNVEAMAKEKRHRAADPCMDTYRRLTRLEAN